jgi:transposase-like protein
MEKDWLADQLNAGRSIEAIARNIGMDPSTVAYWAKKHGLKSAHADRHANKGGIPRERLEALVEQNLSSRQIATELAVSQATVRHWLRKHGLETARTRRKRQIAESLSVDGDIAFAACEIHGHTRFCRRPDGSWRCAQCRSASVVERRRRVKETLVAEAGGACLLCGYATSVGALHFHHLDPGQKEFPVSRRGITMSIESARREAAKCVLLCANCHVEVETGTATLPSS